MDLACSCLLVIEMTDTLIQMHQQILIIFQDPFLILSCLLGVTLGILWGAMPGLSTTMAMTLLLTFTITMSQPVAIFFMLGVYTGSVFGGAISAVLLNIPGTPDAIPTMIEGYPLTVKGEGGLALGTTIMASFLGNWIGIILLIMLIPLILFFSMQFRSWEMFLLAFWGIAICGSLSSDGDAFKGWIAGCIGLLIAFIGIDSIYGVPRMSFGSFYLEDGISFIPVLIGLFGLTEVLKSLSIKDQKRNKHDIGKVIPPLKNLFKFKGTIIRSGLIGTFIGAIPGAGANIASFFSYEIAKKRASKEEKKLWGKGSYEAIVSSEVANNANVGGSMLPTLALGIPGNAAVAALLAALELKNVVVGPLIQIENPGLIYFIYAGLIIANFIMYFMAMMLIKPCMKLFSLPKTILLPLILPICILGSFAVNNNYADVYLMLGAGIVGYFLDKADIPLAPIILALILGPMIDENFRRALLVFENQGIFEVLWDRKLGSVLLLCVLFTFYEGIFKRNQYD